MVRVTGELRTSQWGFDFMLSLRIYKGGEPAVLHSFGEGSKLNSEILKMTL